MISSASIAFMMNGETVPGLMIATLCSRSASTLPMRATMSSNMNGTASRLKACIQSGLVVFCIWMLSAWTSALSAGTSIGVWIAQMSAWSRVSMIWHHSEYRATELSSKRFESTSWCSMLWMLVHE